MERAVQVWAGFYTIILCKYPLFYHINELYNQIISNRQRIFYIKTYWILLKQYLFSCNTSTVLKNVFVQTHHVIISIDAIYHITLMKSLFQFETSVWNILCNLLLLYSNNKYFRSDNIFITQTHFKNSNK